MCGLYLNDDRGLQWQSIMVVSNVDGKKDLEEGVIAGFRHTFSASILH